MRYYIFGCILIGVDQLSKLLTRTFMDVGDSVSIIGDFFRLTYVRNNGAAFSMLSGQRFLLVVLPAIAMGIALWYLHRHKGEHWTMYTSWTMIIAGGIGNLIDRVAFGAVTDMFDFSIFPPVFNVADIGVTLGCALFALYVLMGEKWKKR